MSVYTEQKKVLNTQSLIGNQNVNLNIGQVLSDDRQLP